MRKKTMRGVVNPINIKNLENALKMAFSEKESFNPVIRAIRSKFPIAVGKKVEPFQPAELETEATLRCLRLLREYDVPTLIETKHIYLGLDKYLKIISDMDVAINVTILTGSMAKMALLEPRAPMTDHRWKLVKLLKDSGHWVGVRNEPMMLGIGSSEIIMKRYANRAADAGVDHVNLGGYRVFDPKMAYKNFVAVGMGKEYLKMLKMMDTPDLWKNIGEQLFSLLHARGIKASSSDWDLFFELNDRENCCGTDERFPDFNRFTWQHALEVLKDKGRVKWSDIEPHSDWLGEKKIQSRGVTDIKEIWNLERPKYFALKDMTQIDVEGRDGDGNVIYKLRKKKSLADAFS